MEEQITNKDIKQEYKPLTKWDDIDSSKINMMNVLRGVCAYGFEDPSAIQKQSIPPMIDGKDLIAQAQSGTGKTGAFTVGTLMSINTDENIIQALLMSPTRELAMQTLTVCKELGKFMTNLNIQLCVGGEPLDKCISGLKTMPQIVIGTPGRIFDMINRDKLSTANIKLFVLDEADEMLSQGFKEQIYNIVKLLNKNTQICLFSATIPEECMEITNKFMNEPIKILVKSEELSLEGITQRIIKIDGYNDDNNNTIKYDVLKDLYESISVGQCIVYCNSVERVNDLQIALKNDGFPTCAIHSGMEPSERVVSWKEFKDGKYRIMVSSNVTARGIDIQQVSVVINFDMPRCVHTYLHRIGRSGRWGRKGIAINFVTKQDISHVKNIENHYKISLPELTMNDKLS